MSGYAAAPLEPSLSISAGHALRLGARALRPGLVFVALLFAARTVQAIVGVSLGPALFAAFSGAVGPAIVPAAGMVWLVAQLGAALALAFFARSAVATQGTTGAARPSGALSDALGFLLAGGALGIAARLWVWTALIATGVSFARALGSGASGLASSAALALALLLALPLGFVAAVWVRLGLARAAVRDRGYLLALHTLAGSLFRRGARPVWVFLLGGVAGWILELGTSGVLAPLTPSLTAPGASDFLLARGLVGALFTGAISAGIESWVLGAFCALELAEVNALQPSALPPVTPVPAPAFPVPEVVTAAPILDALPLDPAPVARPAAESTTGPVVDALPLPGTPGETGR